MKLREKPVGIFKVYIVWVGGVPNVFRNYKLALREYEYWINQGYDDVILKTEEV